MKIKTTHRKSDGSTIVEYYKIKKSIDFTYGLIDRILKAEGEAVMFINTNSKLSKPPKEMDEYFKEHNVEHVLYKISAPERKLFGMSVNFGKKKKTPRNEKFIMSEMNSKIFNREFFDEYLSGYDIALGFGGKLTLKEMADEYREDVKELFFDKEYFREFIYVSLLFASARSTLDIEDIAIETEKAIYS